MKLDLHTLTQQHNLTPRGIIHIGAYEGKDLKRYPAPDTAKILLIEANPKAVEHLQANFADKPNIIISQTAIANHNTPVPLNLTSIESNSSIFPLSGYREIYPNLKVTQEITLESRSLDTLLSELNLRPVDFNERSRLGAIAGTGFADWPIKRSEEHTSELQSRYPR
jgi:FkbM family methyltransferase